MINEANRPASDRAREKGGWHRHLTPSFVMSAAALFVALGGTGYAISSLPNGSVGTPQLQTQAVTGAKIARGAVSETKIAPAAVTTTKIAGSAVTSAKIKDGTITEADLSPRLSVKGDTGPQGPSGILWADAQTGTHAQAFPTDPSCGGMACAQLISQDFTTSAAGRVFAMANTNLTYTCGNAGTSTTSLPCNVVVTPFIDGVPLSGGSKQLAGVPYLGSADVDLSLTGITHESLNEGTHTLTVWAFVLDDQILGDSITTGTTSAELLVGS